MNTEKNQVFCNGCAYYCFYKGDYSDYFECSFGYTVAFILDCCFPLNETQIS